MYSVVSFVNKENLSDLTNLFLTSLGPRGRLKIFVTSNGVVRVTSTSTRIVNSLITEICDPCCESILHLVKNHNANANDGGLLLGALVSGLVHNYSQIENPPPLINLQVILFVGTFSVKSHSCLFQKQVATLLNEIKLRVDIGNINQMLAVLRTTMSSKPQVSKEIIRKGSIKLLEGLLETINDDDYNQGDLNLRVEQGLGDEISLEDGMIYPVPETQSFDELRWKKPSGRQIRILLLNCQLSHHL